MQSLEWISPWNIDLVNYEESIDRGSLWKLLWYHDTPTKLIDVIKSSSHYKTQRHVSPVQLWHGTPGDEEKRPTKRHLAKRRTDKHHEDGPCLEINTRRKGTTQRTVNVTRWRPKKTTAGVDSLNKCALFSECHVLSIVRWFYINRQ